MNVQPCCSIRVPAVFDRTADPGYVLSEVEKQHAGEREPELGRREFSTEATKERREAARALQLDGDKERSNCSSADSEERSKAAGQLLDFRLQIGCSGANEGALTQTK